jgi:hypothetical protein
VDKFSGFLSFPVMIHLYAHCRTQNKRAHVDGIVIGNTNTQAIGGIKILIPVFIMPLDEPQTQLS